jgi:hypothetical protein
LFIADFIFYLSKRNHKLVQAMKTIIIALLTCWVVAAQDSYPTDYFRSPLDIPLRLSGSFGELRSNHFHSGLDFKTEQREGLKVYAAADGYVSRIKISSYGYGKAIYINHPNGYTSVYGHLSAGVGAIADYISKEHYRKEAFEIEMFPAPGDLPVKKGQVIALSGNSGGSGGPHLHFEFRDTKTERVINPLLFGFDKMIADTKKPVITNLMVYPIGEQSVVNQSQRPLSIAVSQQPNGSYIAEKIQASGKIGFGIGAHDLFDYTYNKNGVYSIQSYSNGKPFFGFMFDSFAFDESRYINALLDYPRLKKSGVKIQQLFQADEYPLSIIRKGSPDNGIIEVTPNVTRIYKIEVADFMNNKVVLDIPIQYSDQPATIAAEPEKRTNFRLVARNDNSYKKDNISVFIPANTFYNDFFLDFDVADNVLTLHNSSVPVHSNLTVTFEDRTIMGADRDKTFIATLDGKKLSYNATKRTDTTFTAYTRNLGRFMLAKDSIAPRIVPVNIKEGAWLSKQSSISLTISDDLSGIREFAAWLNGKWVLFDYDYKTKKITHTFDPALLEDGRNDLKVKVSDNVGNSAIFETHFFRKK